jgi:hypothetical protein
MDLRRWLFGHQGVKPQRITVREPWFRLEALVESEGSASEWTVEFEFARGAATRRMTRCASGSRAASALFRD